MGAPVNFYSKTGGDSINFYSRPESFANQALLYLAFDGDFTDTVGRHTVSNNGCTISTGTLYAGTGASSFDGSAWLSIPDSDDFDITYTDEFTLNCFFKGTITSIDQFHVFMQTSTDLLAFPHKIFSIYYNTAPPGAYIFRSQFGNETDGDTSLLGMPTITTDVFHRLTIAKPSVSDTFEVYYDSVIVGTFAMSRGSTWQLINGPVTIGAAQGTGDGNPSQFVKFNGWIDEYCIYDTYRVPGGQPVNFYSLP